MNYWIISRLQASRILQIKQGITARQMFKWQGFTSRPPFDFKRSQTKKVENHCYETTATLRKTFLPDGIRKKTKTWSQSVNPPRCVSLLHFSGGGGMSWKAQSKMEGGGFSSRGSSLSPVEGRGGSSDVIHPPGRPFTPPAALVRDYYPRCISSTTLY